jgi:hypothetical protein
MARFRVLSLSSPVASYQRRSLLVGAKAVLVTFLLLVLLGTGWSQSDPPAGIIPFLTQGQGVYESVDLATRNINVQIPLRNKPARYRSLTSCWGITVPRAR